MNARALLLILTVAAARGHAQVREEPSLAMPILAGAGLGVAGFFAGGWTGLALAHNCTSDEYCGLEAAFYGAAVGGTLGLATGVHLGNRRRGSLPLDVLTGAAIWGVGIGGVVLANDQDEATIWLAFITVPIAQLAATVAVERATGRARAGRVGTTVSLVPNRNGGMLLLARVPIP